MKVGIHNIVIPRGEDWDLSFTYKAGGQPVNNTGWALLFTIKDSWNSWLTADAMLEVDQDDAGVSLGGINGGVSIVLQEDETFVLPSGLYVYKLRMGADTDSLRTRFKGQCEVTP